MPLNFDTLALAPIYRLKGVPASFTPAGDDGEICLTVVDATAGMAVADRTLVETIKPAALVRATEIAANGLDRASLARGLITFNGATWKIEAAHVVAGDNGEASGEYQLILVRTNA